MTTSVLRVEQRSKFSSVGDSNLQRALNAGQWTQNAYYPSILNHLSRQGCPMTLLIHIEITR